MARSAHLIFKSDAFPVIPGEDEDTNPGIYGKSLAEWLMAELRERGISVQEVIPEDFAWCVSVPWPPHRAYVACGVAPEDSADWLVFVFVEGGLLARLFGRDRRGESLVTLYEAVKACLAEFPAIRELREQPHDRP